MRFFRRLLRRRREDDLQEEIASHLAMAARDRVADGEDPQSARFAARREFGNVTLTREATRRAWGGLWIERAADPLRDARYAMRLLLRSPGYSAVVIAVLALGIGISLISFGLFQALALTPLAGVRDSAKLQIVMARTSDGRDVALPYRDYEYLRERMQSYDGLAGSFMQGWMIGRGASATRAFGELVSGNYFEVLGVGVQHGRTLNTSDERVRRGHPVAVISDSLWRQKFGADPSVVGSAIDVNTVPLTVVGIAEAEFRGSIPGLASDLFVPYVMQADLSGGHDKLDDPQAHWVFAFGRPRPGVSLTEARAEAAVLAERLATERRADGYEHRAQVAPIWESPQGAQTYMLPAVSLMGVTSGLLLLVVCANVAGLVLVRSLSRRGEIAARLAVGASRARIFRLLLIENLVLAVPGAILGFWLPRLAEPYLGAAQPSTISLPLYFNVGGGPVLFVTIVLACASALLSGVAPALKASRLDLASAMKDDLSPRGSARSPLRSTLVVAQVAVSMILLIGTVLVTRSLAAARQADPGFDAKNVASVLIDLLPAGYDEARGRILYEQLPEALRADPAVVGALLGLAAALAVTRLIASLLYGVSATDVASFSLAAAAVLGVAAAASLVPAWRAGRMDPLVALRHH